MNGLDSFVITSIASNIVAMNDNQLRLLSKMLANNSNGERLASLISIEQFDSYIINKDPLCIEVQESVC